MLKHLSRVMTEPLPNTRVSLHCSWAGVTFGVKQSTKSMFYVTVGGLDGAEICELVGLFIPTKLGLELRLEWGMTM